MKRFLIRGGSIAAGYGVERSYVDILRNRFSGSGIEIINRSRYRETSFDGIWNFHDDIKNFSPDMLMVHFGMDDAFHPVYRSEYRENLVQMIRLTRDTVGAAVILLTSHLLRNIHDTDAVMIYNRAMREVALDLDCILIPFHTYWAGLLIDNVCSIDELVQDDDRYPTEKGHEHYAEMVTAQLNRHV